MLLGVASCASTLRAQVPIVYEVRPSATDATITRFDDPHFVTFAPARRQQHLLLFLTGTASGVKSTDFLQVAVEQGYRVIALAYNNNPAVVARCPRNPDPSCSAKFRHKRIFGDN